MNAQEFRDNQIEEHHKHNRLHDYEAMEAWPLGMFKLAMRFAEDYARAEARVSGEGEPHGD